MQGAVTKKHDISIIGLQSGPTETLPVDFLIFFYAWLDWALVGALVKTWAVDYENNALHPRFKSITVTYRDFGTSILIYTNISANIVLYCPIHGRIPNIDQDTDTTI